jgi:large conductance mechanosensitive channel
MTQYLSGCVIILAVQETKEDEIIKELRKISSLLEPKPAPPPPKGFKNEFVDFISKYKVMGLAVAFILGLYLGAVVQALVKDLLMPVIGLALPGLANLSTLALSVGKQVFGLGDFFVAVITFAIVALVIFVIVKITKRMGIE